MAEGFSRPTLTAHEVAELLEEDDGDFGEIFYAGSDDELGMEEIEVDSENDDDPSESDDDSMYVIIKNTSTLIVNQYCDLIFYIGKVTATMNTS